jgi:hypothetical protein
MARKRIMIPVKSDVFLTDSYQIEGNILEESKRGMLLEKTHTHQKNPDGSYTLSSQFDAKEQRQPYVVIRIKQDENEAVFFKHLEDAQRFYTTICKAASETY